MDALEIAQIYNVAALNGKTIIEASVNTDSIKVNTPEAGSTLDQEIIMMFREFYTLHLTMEALAADGHPQKQIFLATQ